MTRMQPDRLQVFWPEVLPQLRVQWPYVPETAWEAGPLSFDGLVKVVRDAHFPGRAAIMFEGGVRDFVNDLLDRLEARTLA